MQAYTRVCIMLLCMASEKKEMTAHTHLSVTSKFSYVDINQECNGQFK